MCGFFIPPAAIILMTAPILLPIITAAGFDPVWFGVIITINMEIGLITPPVGLSVYTIKGVVGNTVPLGTIFKGILWFLACELLVVVLLVVFPKISLFLPGLMQ